MTTSSPSTTENPARTRSPRVVVLDYGSGNLRSAERALQRVGADVEVTADHRAALAADGLLGRNRLIPLALAPLRLALVTSDGSAACHDVLSELEASGIGFTVGVFDARVQGHGAEASVLAALARAGRAAVDAVLLVVEDLAEELLEGRARRAGQVVNR